MLETRPGDRCFLVTFVGMEIPKFDYGCSERALWADTLRLLGPTLVPTLASWCLNIMMLLQY